MLTHGAGVPRRLRQAVGIALGALLAVVAAQAATGATSGLDRRVFDALYHGQSPAPDGSPPGDSAVLDAVLPLASRLASIPLMLAATIAIALVLAARGRRRDGWFVVGAVLPMGPASRALEELFGRSSPFGQAGTSSFPSGHAMVSFAAAAAVTALSWPTRWRSAVLVGSAAFVGLVGVAVVSDSGHWPSDVVGGWLLAAGWVALLDRRVLRPSRASTQLSSPDASQPGPPAAG